MMPARTAPSAAPANALLVWADAHSIYVQISGSPPTILSFTYSEGGLSKALSILGARKYDFGGQPMLRPMDKNPILTKIMRERGLIP